MGFITSGASAVASFPGLCDALGCTKEREGPGMFFHVHDVSDLGLRIATSAKVPGNLPHVSG